MESYPSEDEPRTKGERTRRALLEAAEQVFASLGYHDASIVKITEAAGVAQGTFYLYFSGKRAIFDVLVEDLNRRLRHVMVAASSQGRDRIAAERLGFEAFFRFTAEHPALYRVIRQAEFVSPKTMRLHYERLAEGYIEGLRRAAANGEIADVDPVVTAWALMAVGEMIGMRWIVWGEANELPPEVFAETMAFVARALGAAPEGHGLSDASPSTRHVDAARDAAVRPAQAPANRGSSAPAPSGRSARAASKKGGTEGAPPAGARRKRVGHAPRGNEGARGKDHPGPASKRAARG